MGKKLMRGGKEMHERVGKKLITGGKKNNNGWEKK